MNLFVFQRTAVTEQGNVIPNAEITVYAAGTMTVIDELYADADGTPQGNPFNAGPTAGKADGFVEFYITFGNYDIAVNGVKLWKNEPIGRPELSDITSLSSLNTAALVDGQQFSVGSYLPDTSTGSALLRWRPNLPKSRHDGVLFFSLTVPMFSGTDTTDYRNGVGETDPGGNGVMELISGEIIYRPVVLIPSYFSTFQKAIDALSDVTVANGAEIALSVESGHVPTTGIEISYADYSRFVLTSQSGTVTCDLTGYSKAWFFGAEHMGKHPQINAVFDVNGTIDTGAYARRSGEIYFRAGAGVINSTITNAYAYRGGRINASRKHTSPGTDDPVLFDGAGTYAARARRGGVFNGVGASMTNAGVSALQLNYGGQGYINAADVTGAVEEHIRCQGGSFCSAVPVTTGGDRLRTNIAPGIPSREGLILAEDSLTRGSWTPVLKGLTTEGSNTYAVQSGRWVAQNGVVEIWGRIVLTNLDSTGALHIDGFPFPFSESAQVVFPILMSAGGNLPGSNQMALRYTAPILGLRKVGQIGSSTVTEADVTNDLEIAFNGRYEIEIPTGAGSWEPSNL